MALISGSKQPVAHSFPGLSFSALHLRGFFSKRYGHFATTPSGASGTPKSRPKLYRHCKAKLMPILPSRGLVLRRFQFVVVRQAGGQRFGLEKRSQRVHASGISSLKVCSRFVFSFANWTSDSHESFSCGRADRSSSAASDVLNICRVKGKVIYSSASISRAL
jgi:hypothetical protein